MPVWGSYTPKYVTNVLVLMKSLALKKMLNFLEGDDIESAGVGRRSQLQGSVALPIHVYQRPIGAYLEDTVKML
jgi:hypothetical protein